jgi:hypothetical protein
MADKKEYSSEEVKVLLDINTSLVNITNALTSMKTTMVDIVEMEKKHGTDLQLFNERMKFLQGLYGTLSTVVDEIKMKVNMLTTQLDYQERKELQTAVIKQREKNKESQKQALKEISKEIAPDGIKKKKFKWADVGNFILKNFKWIAIIILAIATVLILVIGGKEAFKSIADFYKSIFGG